MTKEELLARLSDIEWNDFEVKEASGGLPKSMWETVSAFSNTEGGWIILGVKEKKTEDGSIYVVNGVQNPEQMEQDIITTLRSRTKFKAPISCKVLKYKIDGMDILAFEIPLSPHRPVAIKSNGEVYIRTGSGDTLATDLEVDAIVRDASFGSKNLTGNTVTFESDMLISTVIYPLTSVKDSRNDGENNDENGVHNDNNGENNDENGVNNDNNGVNNDKNGVNNDNDGVNNDKNKVLEIIRKNPFITQQQIAIQTGFSIRKVNRIIASFKEKRIITRIGKTKGGHWELTS